jgi:type IV pilus assembly protein PilY1
MSKLRPNTPRRGAAILMVATLASQVHGPASAQTPLADQPVFTNTAVPGNLALALSVEWPTVSRTAHPGGTYDSANIYRGYFDHDKCYRYVRVTPETLTDVSRFDPVGLATTRQCPATGPAGEWSGNFLNWATMIAIDPFRWALTGGYRKVDEVGNTVLERARHSGQGLFPNRNVASSALISNATPFTWGAMKVRTNGAGTSLIFTSNGTDANLNGAAPTAYQQSLPVGEDTIYELKVRVKVCDIAFLEGNCKKYAVDNWKPEGLIQAYADRMRFSAFGYLNDPAMLRDGGVLRARQKFVGPAISVPGSPTVSNPAFEWDPGTGIFRGNPDAVDAIATTAEFGIDIGNSGVINYLNKFGQLTNNPHKSFDPVSEMFYAVTRYFRNLGNVPAWTAMGSNSVAEKTRFLDEFPVITNWADPIQYSCQRNFVLGIGDINTHRDKNLPGSPTGSLDEPSKPAQISADPVNSVTHTTKAFALQSLGAPGVDNYSGRNNSAGMVGLAYHANTTDLRADLADKQTLSTYWVDVLETPFVANNQFYLAAKYGGFKAPKTFDALTASAIDESWWYTTTDVVGGQKRPDNYFTAGAPDQMISGLTRAFADIAAQLSAFTTSFSTALPQVALAGVGSYASKYDSGTWAGEITANTTTFDPVTGEPSQTAVWNFSSKLATQLALAGTGWDTNRVMLSFNTSTQAGVPFRTANLSTGQLAALDTGYRSGVDSADYLNYLRGETKHEVDSLATGSAKAYRTRGGPMGDIVGSKVRPVGPPVAPYSSAANPGYAAFKTLWKDRTPMLYVGTNAGVLHAINGSVTSAAGGREVFAYVPGALYQGANGSPAQTGLQHRGNPDFTHKNLVDGPISVFDIDLAKTVGGSGAADWRSVLVSGLGKGGKSYFAIDVTDPTAFNNETAAAGKVLWEFTDPDLGYTFGEPAAVKTKKHGWVLIFGSGHNNTSGVGAFFIVNPRTGVVLDKISTGAGTPANPAGLAHVQAFVQDRTDFTVESVYAGDLLGNLWRLDLRQAAGTYPAPLKLAELTNVSGNAVPITSRPRIVVQPSTNRRFVTVGSGKLLHTSDVGNTQAQGFYAIIDGTGNVFNTTLPTGGNFPIRNTGAGNALQKLSNLTLPITLNYATQMGWWLDLGTATGGLGWRVISDSTSFLGTVAFAAMVPSGDVCSPSGSNRIYAIDLGTGQSMLTSGPPTSTVTEPFLTTLPGVVTDLNFFSVGGKLRLYGGTDTGAVGSLNIKQSTPPGVRRLNWRELQLAD